MFNVQLNRAQAPPIDQSICTNCTLHNHHTTPVRRCGRTFHRPPRNSSHRVYRLTPTHLPGPQPIACPVEISFVVSGTELTMAQTPIMRRSATALIAGSRRVSIPRATALSRTYASFSRNRADREMSRMMKAGPKEPTMSVGFKEAAKSMFAEGNSPLFPGSFTHPPRTCECLLY
jgi:hypothetical protein